jgi:prepilin-type N-terminal cleavage/methylation domain-containing protein
VVAKTILRFTTIAQGITGMGTDAVSCSSKGFTLVELLIVVVIMAVLAATVIPEFNSSTDNAKTNTSMFNLPTMRAQLQTYQAQHRVNAPTLFKLTNSAGLPKVALSS